MYEIFSQNLSISSLFINTLKFVPSSVDTLTFLLSFFFFIMKSFENLNVRATKAIVYIYHKYFVVTINLTNYADNTSLISLPASFFMIFRGNSCIEAK